ncbi:MAG: hypothetical protein KC643_10025 [Nitrospira sp.]|nr:hypothetical protein [Nitrospira sp.]MCA9465764.1 hypothetical protein [Nitrospira sp.]
MRSSLKRQAPARRGRASWALPVSATNTYDVYARWVDDPAHATNATYTVYYSGGTTPVSINQTQNGGKWNLLGTFTLDPSLNPKVELSDQAMARSWRMPSWWCHPAPVPIG